MLDVLANLNKGSTIEQEKLSLKPANRPLLRCEERICHVDHCALVHVKKHAYSVPEDLVNQEITARIYMDHIDFFRKDELVCSHEKSTESGKTVDIRHYIRTLKQKPGALCDSIALRSNPKLKMVYDVYYSKSPADFIELVERFKDLPLDEMAEAICELAKVESHKTPSKSNDELSKQALVVASMYNNLTVGNQ